MFNCIMSSLWLVERGKQFFQLNLSCRRRLGCLSTIVGPWQQGKEVFAFSAFGRRCRPAGPGSSKSWLPRMNSFICGENLVLKVSAVSDRFWNGVIACRGFYHEEKNGHKRGIGMRSNDTYTNKLSWRNKSHWWLIDVHILFTNKMKKEVHKMKPLSSTAGVGAVPTRQLLASFPSAADSSRPIFCIKIVFKIY